MPRRGLDVLLRNYLAKGTGWDAFDGPNGRILKAWSEHERGLHDWVAVNELIQSDEFFALFERHYKGWGCDSEVVERLHDNCRALVAIRLGDVEEAERWAPKHSHLWSHAGPSLQRRFQVLVPVVAVKGQTHGHLLELDLEHCDLARPGLFMQADMALTPITRKFLDTMEEAAGRHLVEPLAWRLRFISDYGGVVDGASIGGAACCGFHFLRERRSYPEDTIVLASTSFAEVDLLKPKLDVLVKLTENTTRRFRRVLLGAGANAAHVQQGPHSEKFAIHLVDGLETALEAMTSGGIPPGGGVDPRKSPYPGARSFEPHESPWFYGRKRELGEVAEMLDAQDTRMVILCAASGVGKSSFIEAGLRATLPSRGFEVLPTARVTRAGSIVSRGNPYTAASLHSLHAEGETSEPDVSWSEFFATRTRTAPRRVLVLDQLEEIETVASLVSKSKTEFFNELWQALHEDRDLRVLLCFREEYLAAINGYLHQREGDRHAARQARRPDASWSLLQYRLELLRWDEDDESARLAITKPAAEFGVTFTSQALTSLRGALVDTRTNRVEPLLLQLLCTRIWKELPRWTPQVDLLALAQVVDRESAAASNPAELLMQQVMAQFCESAISTAAEENDSPRELIKVGLRQFIANRYRAAIPEARGDEGFTGDLPTAVVRTLAAKGLLRCDVRRDGRFYELAHDRLIDHVLRVSEPVNDELRTLFEHTIAILAAESTDPTRTADACVLALVGEGGARLSVARRAPSSRDVGPKVWAGLLRAGLLRPSRDDAASLLELTHPALALALLPLRVAALHPFDGMRPKVYAVLRDAAIGCLAAMILIRPVMAWSAGIFRRWFGDQASAVIAAWPTSAVHASLTPWQTMYLSDDRIFVAAFHAIYGALVWGAAISAGFIVQHTRWRRDDGWDSLRAMIVCGIAGFIGGVACAVPSVLVTNPIALETLGWGRGFEGTLTSRMFLAFPLTGMFTGLGTGIFLQRRLDELVEQGADDILPIPVKVSGASLVDAVGFVVTAPRFHLYLLFPLLFSWMALIVLRPEHTPWPMLLAQSAGEGFVHYVGAIGLTAGFFMGVKGTYHS